MEKEELKQALLRHPLVVRLRRNPNWAPAADAAVEHFAFGKKCEVASWVKSSTWTQVRVAFDEIQKQVSLEKSSGRDQS
jgi:hypothetical protein